MAADHGRGGSYALMFGPGIQRECLCGLSFIGTSEESFAEREAHIAEAVAGEQGAIFEADQGHQPELFS